MMEVFVCVVLFHLYACHRYSLQALFRSAGLLQQEWFDKRRTPNIIIHLNITVNIYQIR